MSSYKFAYDQFVCTKNPDEMEKWVDSYGAKPELEQIDSTGAGPISEPCDIPDCYRQIKYVKMVNGNEERCSYNKRYGTAPDSDCYPKRGAGSYTYSNYPELKHNCEYRKGYSTLSAHEKKYEDTKAHYDKTWRQSVNLSLGIVIMLVGIYYQK